MLDSDEWSRVPTIQTNVGLFKSFWAAPKHIFRLASSVNFRLVHHFHVQLTLDCFYPIVVERKEHAPCFFMLAPKAQTLVIQTQPNKLAME